MSLPHQLLSAEPLVLADKSTSSVESLAMKQIPFAQMERLLLQLSQLSEYTNQLFLDLENTALSQQNRFERVNATIIQLRSKLPSRDAIRLETVPKRKAWQGNHSILSNVFTKETLPHMLLKRYQDCQPAPNLSLLDKFRFDGHSCMRFYSYPEFFVDEWKSLLQTKSDQKAKRKHHTNIIKIDAPNDLQVKSSVKDNITSGKDRETPHLDNFVARPITNQRPKVEERTQMQNSRLQSVQIKSAPVAAAPPPPPPPPPPPLSVSLPKGAGFVISPSSTPVKPNPILLSNPLKSGGGLGFLTEIRSNQFALKKSGVDPESAAEKKKLMNERSDVAAILMRRAALEASDSDDSGGDNEGDWD